MEENKIPKRVLYMNLGTTRLRGRPRSRWQDEVRKEWKTLLRTAWNHLHSAHANGVNEYLIF